MYGNEASIRFSPGISTPSNRGICKFQGLALSLFVSRIFANHTDNILSLYDSAALTEPLHRRSHFHPNSSLEDKKTQPEEIASQERFSFTTTSLLPGSYSAFRLGVTR